MLVLGLWFSIGIACDMISPILIFTVMLSLAYSVFQGNVGPPIASERSCWFSILFLRPWVFVLVLEKREEKKRAVVARRQPAGVAASAASTLARSRELRQ